MTTLRGGTRFCFRRVLGHRDRRPRLPPRRSQPAARGLRAGVAATGGVHRIVEPAHMELAEPSLETAFDACVAAGATTVVIAPYFLGPGQHWDRDIPALAAAACRAPSRGPLSGHRPARPPSPPRGHRRTADRALPGPRPGRRSRVRALRRDRPVPAARSGWWWAGSGWTGLEVRRRRPTRDLSCSGRPATAARRRGRRGPRPPCPARPWWPGWAARPPGRAGRRPGRPCSRSAG